MQGKREKEENVCKFVFVLLTGERTPAAVDGAFGILRGLTQNLFLHIVG